MSCECERARSSKGFAAMVVHINFLFYLFSFPLQTMRDLQHLPRPKWEETYPTEEKKNCKFYSDLCLFVVLITHSFLFEYFFLLRSLHSYLCVLYVFFSASQLLKWSKDLLVLLAKKMKRRSKLILRSRCYVSTLPKSYSKYLFLFLLLCLERQQHFIWSTVLDRWWIKCESHFTLVFSFKNTWNRQRDISHAICKTKNTHTPNREQEKDEERKKNGICSSL